MANVAKIARSFIRNDISQLILTRKICSTIRYQAAKIIDGKAMAQNIQDEVKGEINSIISKGGRAPFLCVIQVGEDPASTTYVKNKIKAAQYTGIQSENVRLPSSTTQDQLLDLIHLFNKNNDVDGILVQLPLTAQMNEKRICNAVAPNKDVDGFNVVNVGKLCVDELSFIPATPAGVMEIIRRTGIETFGKNAVVCGRSKNVGMPIAMLLHADGIYETKAGDATTTICHRYTPPDKLVLFTKNADIIVTATGVPNLITADMVKEGVAVIDVGISRVKDERTGKTRLVGDVDFEGVRQKASYITPVPGGVGPMTVAMLMKNTLMAYKKVIKID